MSKTKHPFKLVGFSMLMIAYYGSKAQDTQIRGFADANAEYTSDSLSNKTKKNGKFELGAIDMFITSQYDKVSFIGEVAYEGDENNGDGKMDIERMIIKYDINEYFKVSFGKFHSTIGYWSSAYVHSSLLQPTIDRPTVLQDDLWEEQLNLKKNMGFQISGDGISKYNLGYNLAITNGMTNVNFVDDLDNNKAVTLKVTAEPVDNFKLFASGYRDVVPAGLFTMRGDSMTKSNGFSVLNFGVAYMKGDKPYEFIAEVFDINNNSTVLKADTAGVMRESSSGRKTTLGYMLYAGYRIKKFTPYISYDALNYSKGEQYLNTNNVNVFLLGVRYAYNAKSVIKLEYKHKQDQHAGIANIVEMQFSFGF